MNFEEALNRLQKQLDKLSIITSGPLTDEQLEQVDDIIQGQDKILSTLEEISSIDMVKFDSKGE